MIYSDNLTNRELLMNAMPLSSLSREQWNLALAHVQSTNGEVHKVLETLIANQSKLEVISNYKEYYYENLDEPVTEHSVTGLLIE